MTLLLVMLHTGTMFAVIVYFWRKWREAYFQSLARFKRFAMLVLLATAITGGIGEALIKVLERVAFPLQSHGEVEELFSHLELIAPALAAVGVLILIAGIVKRRTAAGNSVADEIGLSQAGLIGGSSSGCACHFAGSHAPAPRYLRECLPACPG